MPTTLEANNAESQQVKPLRISLRLKRKHVLHANQALHNLLKVIAKRSLALAPTQHSKGHSRLTEEFNYIESHQN